MSVRRTRRAAAGAMIGTVAVASGGLTATTSAAQPDAQWHFPLPKEPVATGYGGAVATVDADATSAGLSALSRGGNAVDAAVASAAALGVTDPFSAGIGGGGFFVYYDASTGKVTTLDGRETAPSTATDELFIDPETGEPLGFQEARVSGLSIGAPGTLATWEDALDRWGRHSLGRALRPATRIAERGFVVDETFRSQVAGNEHVFNDFPASADLFLPDGELPVVGETFTNPDLADTYRTIARHGTDVFYGGPVGEEIAATVQEPPVRDGADRVVRSGDLTADDVAGYDVIERDPTHVNYRGYDVYGMPPPSSGGSTVGEALNILENAELSEMEESAALHHYLEALALAFADRNRYVGDPDAVDVPLDELLSQEYADERFCELDPDVAASKPVAPGTPDGDYDECGASAGDPSQLSGEGSTTHLTTADRWGNVVAYTLTIEQTGGSGITVPDRGFLLNNELTDFNFAPSQGDAPEPNLPGPGKRPRSSMSPTIVLEDGKPFVALGSPGGSTIIGTVLQTLVNRIDLGMEMPDAVASPRLTQRNRATTMVEESVLGTDLEQDLIDRGHELTSTSETGALTGVEILDRRLLQAVAEPERRGGGSAAVVLPRWWW